MASHRIAFVLSGLLLAGCGSPTSSNNSPDLATADADCAKNPAACGGCGTDSDCPMTAPRCDKSSAKCQPCLPDNDNCAMGSHCVPMGDGFTCSTKCRNDADCPKSDGGVAETCCSGACVDTSGDLANCGSCGKECPQVTNGTGVCTSGACAIGSCIQGFGDCDKAVDNGCEANLSSDSKNCGMCGTTCSAGPNSANTCQSSNCVFVCDKGFADCDNDPKDGCEVSTDTDVNNCGACNTACGNAPNATLQCSSGKCGIAMCTAGFADCDMNYQTGCEVSTDTDPGNCGSCANVCNLPNAVPACMAGMCALNACNNGFGDCDGIIANGCEVQTSTDPNNCGACGMVCGGMNSMQACGNGQCMVTGCTQGFADCDMKAADGCEANLSSPMTCGGCGIVCAFANASPACNNNMCAIASCNGGFGNCDGNAQNGCEKNLTNDVSNCGMCAKVCAAPANATAGCGNGMCGIGMCNGGFADCNNNAQDGCEKNLNTDANNCNACGKVCAAPANATAGCANGVCGIGMCNAGFGDCDGQAANGCEKNLNTDVNNCGKCGTVCGNGNTCTAGKCVAVSPCDPNTEVFFNGNCYYLDGSNGVCDAGYALVSQAVLTNIAPSFVGKNYKHTVSSNCCIENADANENWGFNPPQCNGAGPFTIAPSLGGAGCTNVMNKNPGQLTLCGKPACDPNTEVLFNGHCYYLDGSNGVCDPGYSLAPDNILTNIAASFIGKNYKHTVSSNCCIENANNVENWGFNPPQCNGAGPFTIAPSQGGAGCTNVMNKNPGQLTLCFK